jgi:hypothetical protein
MKDLSPRNSNSLPGGPNPHSNPTEDIRNEFEAHQALFTAQPVRVQRFLEAQAGQLADVISRGAAQARFMLPDQVVLSVTNKGTPDAVAIQADLREVLVGGVIERLIRNDIRSTVRQKLVEMEGAESKPVATAAGLLRFAVAWHMVHNMLPAGRTVTYRAVEGEEIPTIPVEKPRRTSSAITQASDAIVEEEQPDGQRGELQVPYVPAASRFYLPHWVAFDDEGNILVKDLAEAEAHLASMQRFLGILHMAVSLAPYFVCDPEYQQKRYGMLGQLINQGRALANFETFEIVTEIKRRAAAHNLNRGLSLSLPYFDDQDLVLRTHDFEVIPAGRIMFVPAFVVRAAREEEAKVAQDTRLSPSTRKYLLIELGILEKAFFKFSKE